MTPEQRIKLAEAMGWPNSGTLAGKTLQVNQGYPENGPWVDEPAFFPENNANDDYAVLEWVFNEWPLGMQQAFSAHQIKIWTEQRTLCGITSDGILDPSFYRKVGDNARAALRVIEAGKP